MGVEPAAEPRERQPPSLTEDEGLPYHEAAHAVAALAQGLKVQLVTIEPGTARDGRRYRGRTLVGGLPPPPGKLEPDDLERVLLCVLAEEAATDHLIRTPGDRVRTLVARRGDEHMIRAALNDLRLEPEAAEALLAQLRTRAAELVETHWLAIAALANTLRERLTLDGEEARAMFEAKAR